MNFIKKNIEWVIFCFCILIFILLALGVHFNKFENMDANVHSFISQMSFPLADGFWLLITNFVSPVFIILFLISLLIIISNKKYGLLLLINTGIALLLNQILKLIFSRPRPFELMMIDQGGYSFPSGHSMVALAFYGFFIYILWKMNLPKKVKKFLTIILIILIILIGLSRIYLGVHYPSDILAGFAIALAYLIIFIKIVKKYEGRSEKNEKSIQ